jgi:hypothetical protein
MAAQGSWPPVRKRKYRNGKLAVLEAGRACELTNWQQERFVSTLASAYAEAGDFASALF